ncbi:MAG: hypothetical protein MZV64_09885 [Ignavibacteriales bacterium]|nr:hypothetical protein [Ignavibacteriales bacterium]
MRDPFFGLDWSWNLGKAVSDALYPNRRNRVTDNDVRISAFALVDRGSSEPANGSQTYEPYPANFEIGGYRVDGLRPLLYVLAIREPGSFYIASFNRRMGQERRRSASTSTRPCSSPTPNAGGVQGRAVFESAAETSLEAVLRSGILSRFRPPGPDPGPAGLRSPASSGRGLRAATSRPFGTRLSG